MSSNCTEEHVIDGVHTLTVPAIIICFWMPIWQKANLALVGVFYNFAVLSLIESVTWTQPNATKQKLATSIPSFINFTFTGVYCVPSHHTIHSLEICDVWWGWILRKIVVGNNVKWKEANSNNRNKISKISSFVCI